MSLALSISLEEEDLVLGTQQAKPSVKESVQLLIKCWILLFFFSGAESSGDPDVLLNVDLKSMQFLCI